MKSFSFILLLALFCFVGQASELRYAKNFSIRDHEDYREIEVRNTWVGAGDEKQVYALVPRGSDLPELDDSVVVIRTPVERLAVMTTVFLGVVHELDLYESLAGVANPNFVNDQRTIELLEAGKVKELQSGSSMNLETMMLLQPDLVLTSTTGNPTFDVDPQLSRSALPIVVTAAYMEEHPLGRTEWIKFVAAFYGEEKQALADIIFNEVATEYERLVELAAAVESRPTVLTNAPFGGSWHVSGGQSYTAKALEHAGADYLWKDLDSSGSQPMDIEIILQRAADVDIWLNPSSYSTMKSLLAQDERYVAFKALREGEVYNKTVRVNENGGNDIYERGVAHPEEVLADLIKIFHPELLPEHEFVFYEKLK
ncbi:ABC transporter substrate-binding protein [Pelagicoccus albus]|uniref:ABC transporter substrate-binding protein n=1 Tax=Pelagicoccus albus TaxID=415222 RepID=A0A7X1EBE7_9BACT|nr:ABC transporter substrate-binding protein [Pelagicoccus albus]MBC2607732.1 ABC transporter substrate-binding protein [Pelagicoccus albus]